MKLTIAAVLGALLCALPAAAHAQSFSVPDARMSDWNFRAPAQLPPQGPALAGDSVLWWEQREDDTAVLMLASATAKAHAVVQDGTRDANLRLAAFGNRVIAQATSTWEIDVRTSTAKRIDTCFGSAACSSCRARTGGSAFRFELVGSVLATGQKAATVCESGAVHDFADGATRNFPGPVLAAAGTYAVVREATEMALYNWRTGQRLRTLGPGPFEDEFARGVAVDERGTVVFADLLERSTHNPFGATNQVRLAGGLLAHRRDIAEDDFDEDFGATSRSVFWVSRPDGSATRRVRGQRTGGGWDFDGRRLAWATQPCTQITIQVWDLAGDQPAPASERCGVPRVRKPRLRFGSRSIWFRAICPRRPARGCDGEMHAVIRRLTGGPKVAVAVRSPLHIAAGENRRTGLEVLDSRSLRKVRGPFRVRFIFESHGRRTAVTRTVRR